MSQGEPHQLSIGRLQRRLEAAERLNRSYQDQIDHMKQIISEICAMHDLDPPDLRYAHYVPIRRTEEYERQGEQEDIDGNQSTELTQQRISEMVVNTHTHTQCLPTLRATRSATAALVSRQCELVGVNKK